jgi:RNA polymerase sigma-70 factor, ECF subfamily
MSDFATVIEAHRDAVWRTVYRLLSHREDALDCFQQTFLDALRLTGQGEIRHWPALLQRIATRRAFDRLRERYQSQKAAAKTEGRPVARSPAEPPGARLDGEELQEQVRRALGELPAEQAEAFWLRHLEELSVGEVAEQMGIEPGHVRVLVHRAAVGLRGLLGPSFGPATVSEESP